MSLDLKVSGAYKTVPAVAVKVGDTWKTGLDMWTRVSGAWKKVWQALSATIFGTLSSFAYISTNPTTTSVVASLSITGTGPYTYLWSHTGVPSSVTSNTGSTYILRLTSGVPVARSGTVTCTVSDSYGNTFTTPTRTWSLELAELV